MSNGQSFTIFLYLIVVAAVVIVIIIGPMIEKKYRRMQQRHLKTLPSQGMRKRSISDRIDARGR